MKTVIVNGQNVIVFKGRGLGDGGVAMRYLVEEADGTYSEVGVWYADPARAAKVYEAPDDAHLAWVIDEARRQTVQSDLRPAPKAYVEPEALKEAAIIKKA